METPWAREPRAPPARGRAGASRRHLLHRGARARHRPPAPEEQRPHQSHEPGGHRAAIDVKPLSSRRGRTTNGFARVGPWAHPHAMRQSARVYGRAAGPGRRCAFRGRKAPYGTRKPKRCAREREVGTRAAHRVAVESPGRQGHQRVVHGRCVSRLNGRTNDMDRAPHRARRRKGPPQALQDRVGPIGSLPAEIAVRMKEFMGMRFKSWLRWQSSARGRWPAQEALRASTARV